MNWGSSGQAHAYSDALKTTLKLVNVDEHVKNFRSDITLKQTSKLKTQSFM